MSQEQPSRGLRERMEVEAALAGALRSSLGRFVTGVAVVTFEAEEGPRGLTVNSFTVGVARSAADPDQHRQDLALTRAPRGRDPVHRQHPRRRAGAVARHFTRRGGEGPITGSSRPVATALLGTLAHFECAPWRSYDAGDHTLVLGEVVDFDTREGDALGFFASRFRRWWRSGSGHEDLF